MNAALGPVLLRYLQKARQIPYILYDEKEHQSTCFGYNYRGLKIDRPRGEFPWRVPD